MANPQKRKPHWTPRNLAVLGLSRRDRNAIFHALMDRAMERRALQGGNCWNTRYLENLAERVAK